MEIVIRLEIESDEPIKVKVEQTEDKVEDQAYSIYARFFDESSSVWSKDAEQNLTFLKLQQQNANAKLKVQGYLFLNDVYDMLGIARTKAGQVVGWVYDENNTRGDNYVDFGIYKDGNRTFVNGYERSILLDFNVDGNILDRIK